MTLRYLISPEERRRKLKNLLESRNIIRGLEVHNPLSALIVNNLQVEVEKNSSKKINEFDFFWASSLTDSASRGYPDIEIIGWDSRIKTLLEIMEVTNKPIVVDGDTGGDIHHFEYLIPKLERIGISAVIIEDKIFPKRNSLESGTNQDQEDSDKFAEKIKIGKRIQKSEDFMIIARIESLISGKDVKDALTRAKKYLESGADGIMIHSKSSDPKEILEFAAKYKEICKDLNLKRPLVCVPTTYNSLYESELGDKGFSIVIYANHMLRAACKAMKDVGKIILENERSLEADPHISPVREIFDMVGFLDIKEKDIFMSQKPAIIIPAAGENKEFKTVLGNIPKSLMIVNGKTILEHQISIFRKFGLEDINVVIGYERNKFDIKNISYFQNDDYATTGVLNSIMKAKEKMKNGFVYINSDIIFDDDLLKSLLERKEDIVIVVDKSYLYHKHEIDKKLDAVITKSGRQEGYQRLRNKVDEVVLVGKKIPKELMTHEFIGLAKFSKEGAENLIKVYEDCVENHSGPLHEAENLDVAADTDMIQEMINRGFKVHIHETNGGWIEIHNENDLLFAKDVLSMIE